jgi:hypothetical protein
MNPDNVRRRGFWDHRRCELTVFRRGVSNIMIGNGVPSFQLNEINGLKGSQ